MAIDTETKRRSAAWVGWPGPVAILPSGTIGQAVRQQIGWTYCGILVSGVAVVLRRLRTLMEVGL